ncbi:MAG: hypothetical protein H6819_07875 [Phycisphaerales bacterium]|nr:hypothetical protein [Phycisphaerales bacterium]MCB9854307.1 hypothetical protein [Phycisphaerales bacterium]MCB9863508.1 hypothetical protein [Phycisphaerales bacterium]
MLSEERLEMTFERDHVQEPFVCNMASRHPDVLFNIHQLSVGPHEARMMMSVIGEVPHRRAVREYFEGLGVDVRVIDELKYKGTIPQVPNRIAMPTASTAPVRQKLWLTIVGALRSQHFLWTISRRFDVVYKITQSVTGDPVSIVSMVVSGTQAEVDGVVAYMREQGINVETGVINAAAPFGVTS